MLRQYAPEENIQYGTRQQPMEALHFESGPGTPNEEYYFASRHWHNNIEILLITHGNFNIELNLENIPFAKNDICMINSGELHQIKSREPESSHDMLQFAPKILDFTYEDEMQEGLTGPLIMQRQILVHKISPADDGYSFVCRELRKMIKLCQEKRTGWYLQAKSRLLLMLCFMEENHMLLPSGSVYDQGEKEKINRYKTIVSYLEKNYMDKITLPDIAEKIGCTPQYMCQFFKSIAGVSPIQYLILFRIKEAKKMLKYSSHTVLEISMECGFENVSYFIRQFKKCAGMTPNQYRKNLCQ